MKKVLRDSPGTMDGPRKRRTSVGPGGNPCGEVSLGKAETCMIQKWPWLDERDGSEIHFGHFRLVVHHYVGYPPEMWFMSVYGLRERVELKAKTLEEAKQEALKWLLAFLMEATARVAEAASGK